MKPVEDAAHRYLDTEDELATARAAFAAAKAARQSALADLRAARAIEQAAS